MENPLVTIIIPVYKVEKYLHRCVNSVVSQTYCNLEIILVDDGSPDSCPQLCDEWASRDSRIKVIHKNNGGLSSARNLALDICTGEYICFVDSDDWVADDMIEVLLRICRKYQVQLAVCGRYDVYDGKETPLTGKNPLKEEVIDAESATARMLLGIEFDCSAWGKLYHRSLWDKNRFPFGKIYEDVAILYKVVLETNNIALTSKSLYYYFRRPDSITGSPFSDSLFDYPVNTRKVLEDIRENHQNLYDYACWTHTKAIQCVLSRLGKADEAVYKKHIAVFKQLSGELLSYKATWRHSTVFTRQDVMLCSVFSRWYIIRPLFQFKQILKNK